MRARAFRLTVLGRRRGCVAALLAPVLAHELAHALAARRRGIPVKSITLFVFGGVSDIEREPQSAGAEFQMAFVGPLTSPAIGIVMAVAGLASGALGWQALLTTLLIYLGLANLPLGVFTLSPSFPMDGGRVLRAIIWRITGDLHKATRWAANVGQAVAFLMIFAGIWLFFSGYWADGIWIGLIGLFILQAAQAEFTQAQLEATMAGASVRHFMSSLPLPATPDLPVQYSVDEYVLRSGQRLIPVVERGSSRLIGIVSPRDIRLLPRDRWSSVVVGQVMTPRS